MVTFLTCLCRGIPLIIGNVSEDRCFVVQVGASIGRLQEEAKAIKNDLSAAHSQQKSRQTSKILSDFEVCSSMCKTGRRHLMLSRNSAFFSGLCLLCMQVALAALTAGTELCPTSL